jgi:hypothetical protein
VHVSGLDNEHRADVLLALEEMPTVGCFRPDEPRQIQGVIGIREDEEVFLRPAHPASVARRTFSTVTEEKPASSRSFADSNDRWTCAKFVAVTDLDRNLIAQARRFTNGANIDLVKTWLSCY